MEMLHLCKVEDDERARFQKLQIIVQDFGPHVSRGMYSALEPMERLVDLTFLSEKPLVDWSFYGRPEKIRFWLQEWFGEMVGWRQPAFRIVEMESGRVMTYPDKKVSPPEGGTKVGEMFDWWYEVGSVQEGRGTA